MKERNKNSGFSLIELVVALAIMGTVAMISVNMYGNISSADVKSAAENINVMLSKLRSESLTKAYEYELAVETNASGEHELKLYEKREGRDASGAVVYTWKVVDNVNLGASVDIKGINTAGIGCELNSTYKLLIKCSKANGKYTYASCEDSSGVPAAGFTTEMVNKIEITKKKHKKVVKLVIPTGRHYVE